MNEERRKGDVNLLQKWKKMMTMIIMMLRMMTMMILTWMWILVEVMKINIFFVIGL